MNHKLQLVAATLAGVLVTVAAGGIAMASMARGPTGPFAHADANGDGTITRAEWIAAANARFDQLDTNKDGRLIVGEIPPPRWRHHRPHPERPVGAPSTEHGQPGNAG